MGMVDDVEEQKKRIELLEKQVESSSKKGKRKFTVKVPAGVARLTRKDGVFAALVLGADKKASFKKGLYSDGLVYVDGKPYAYEDSAIYYLKKARGFIPLIVVYEWRLTPVGGGTEELVTRAINSRVDKKFADDLGIGNFGQQTIIRAIEQAALPADRKKLGGISPIAWLFIGVGVIYLLSRFFGGG